MVYGAIIIVIKTSIENYIADTHVASSNY